MFHTLPLDPPERLRNGLPTGLKKSVYISLLHSHLPGIRRPAANPPGGKLLQRRVHVYKNINWRNTAPHWRGILPAIRRGEHRQSPGSCGYSKLFVQ